MSYLCNGNPYIWKDGLYIETGPCLLDTSHPVTGRWEALIGLWSSHNYALQGGLKIVYHDLQQFRIIAYDQIFLLFPESHWQ